MTKLIESDSAVDAILRFNANRKPELVTIKYARMVENVFAFFRGTDHLFADHWPQCRPRDAGPGILTCGDLHLENFGAYQTDDGDFRFDINDFDEALVAAAGFDLVRATASILLAAEVWKISVAPASCMALEFLTAYRAAVIEAARTGQPGEIVPGKGDGPISKLLGETALGEQAAMLDHHTEIKHHGQRRIIRSPDKHPDISEDKARIVGEAIENYGKTTATPDAYCVLDVAGRIMGVGSLGLRRYTVLIAGGGTPASNRLLDVKEAAPSAVLACSEFPQPDTHGDDALRIVLAQRQLQSKPTAGLAPIVVGKRPFRLREMIPDENRSKLDRLQRHPDKLRTAVTVAGQLTAWSQIRGCPPEAEARQKLASWADGSALDAVLTAAARSVDITCRDFESFCLAYAAPDFEKRRPALSRPAS
jgi:uncharacterized protein (DUF2252 family)